MVDWSSILTQVILAVVGIVITTVGGYITVFLSSKIKDERLRRVLVNLNTVVNNSVKYVYQIYVEELKGTDGWNKETMKIANEKALEYVKTNLTDEMKQYLAENNKDITEWASEQIEIAINAQKVLGKATTAVTTTGGNE